MLAYVHRKEKKRKEAYDVRGGVAAALSVLAVGASRELGFGSVPPLIRRVREPFVARLVPPAVPAIAFNPKWSAPHNLSSLPCWRGGSPKMKTDHPMKYQNMQQERGKFVQIKAAVTYSSHPGGGANCGGCWLPCHPAHDDRLRMH